MASAQVIPFAEAHLAELPPAAERRARVGVLETLRGPYRAAVLEYSRTILLAGRPVAAWGVIPLWEGVGSAWAWLGEPCRRHPALLIRLAREGLAEAHQKLCLRRIQAEVSADLPAGVRFAKLVGFEVEGLLRAYGCNGGDFWMLASVPRGNM